MGRYVDNPGRTYPKITVVCYLLLLLSLLPVLLAGALETDIQFFLLISIYGVVLSLTGASVSLLAYTKWSFQKQRDMKHQRPSKRDEHTIEQIIRILNTGRDNQESLDEYDKRVQKTLMGLVLALMSGALPMDILVRGVLFSWLL